MGARALRRSDWDSSTYVAGAGRACAIDLVHLSRQTMGDRELETELLGIFERQAAQIAAQLSEEFPSSCTAGEAVRRADLAHKLKGSARAVGAFAVASAAENYEHAARAGLLRASDAAAVADAVDTARAALRDLAN